MPVYGPALIAIGLCNRDAKLPASGTFITGPYKGPANRRPRGVALADLELTRPTATVPGRALARLSSRLRARGHAASLLLTDAASGDVVALDYRKATTLAIDQGNIREVRLALPAAAQLPARIRAYVITDAFPLAVREL